MKPKTIPPAWVKVSNIFQSLPKPNKPQPKTESIIAFPTPRPHNAKTRELFGQLIKLLHGDSQAANRLIDAQRNKNSNKSEEWVIQKVIDDLTGDRR
jgi:hypothetical protein